MIRDADIAKLCRGIYAYPGDAPVAWDHFDDGHNDGIVWAVKRIDATDVVVFRGSRTLRDWILDFDGLANPFTHDALGPVHPGFLLGIDQVLKEYTPIFHTGACEVIVAGHSLGAARAAIMAGLMLASSWEPAALITFGQPKPGFAKLATIIKAIPSRWYSNGDADGHDLVTELGFSFPPEEYVHAGDAMRCSQSPAPDHWKVDGMFAYHDMRLYDEAMGDTSPVITA